jgi:uncharacterized protein (TIGR02646 family)
MIFVLRTQEPEVLRRSAAQWLIELEAAITELARLESDRMVGEQAKRRARKEVEKAQGRYRHWQVKAALVTMFHGKCAYCESKITVVTYGQIEHFYPKGQYVERTFQWENLLLSCDLCNNAQHKGTRFPLDGDRNPLLIDPTTVMPEDHLLFSWDQRAGLAWVYGITARGKETVEMFDLNGDRGRKELIKGRCEHVRVLMVLNKFAEQGNAEARSLLLSARESDAPYAAFARTCIEPRFCTRI